MFDFLKRVGLIYWLEYGIVHSHFKIWHRLKKTGQENIPLEGGVIVASNHLSHLDSPPIGGCIPRRARYVADTEMFKKPILKWYLPLTGGIPIRRGGGGSDMIDISCKVLNNGDLMILYPEGTRTRTGHSGRARTGIVVIAKKTGVPIVPCRISGTYECWPYSSVWPKPGPIQVSFGEPIRWNPDKIDLNDREDMARKAEEVMDAIQALPGWMPKTANS